MKRSRFKKLKKPLIVFISLIVAVLSGTGLGIVIKPTDGGIKIETTFGMRLAETQLPAELESIDGEKIIDENIVTVEEVSSNQIVECDENEECGKGRYIYAPTDSPQAFKEYVYGKCWNTDDKYGAQCWDLADLFWQNYAGRNFSTCGTGAAKGSWNCKEYNAGDDFELIYNPEDLQTGDWIIFSSGTYGHVGMATGGYNNGYITLAGQNQGGSLCAGSTMGGRVNIINISLKYFAGAFRPKTYIKPTPTPTPEDNTCKKYDVKWGDTLSQIMLECTGKVEWGDKMNDYAKSWFSTKIKPNQSIYDGWNSAFGVGLYAGDVIEYKD